MAARRVDIVPHTHWDREWYAPFPVFRHRLVGLIDGLIELLESGRGYDHFLLDGQMAVVDDYLEIRPENAERLRALALDGRLAMGPWYILMDEFLCSPETIIRNLQMGLDAAARFGGAMDVGYLPDMFGHIAQMPQILRQAGFEHAVVWRGVPRAVDRTAFWWKALDGSTVRATYLPVGYGNGAMTPSDPAAFAGRLADHEAELSKMLRLTDAEAILWMNGTDHQLPQPWLGEVVSAVNADAERWDLRVTCLADHLRAAPSDDLPLVVGELRSGAGANLLMGVVSNRVDIRVAAARAEVALERRAEPLAALFLGSALLGSTQWPGRELALAWRAVVLNSAHDSICACSHDDVGLAVMHRFAEATATGNEIARSARHAFGRSLAEGGTYVLNPSHRDRSGIVEIVVPGEAQAGDAAIVDQQVLAVRPTVLLDVTLPAAELPSVLGRIRSQAFGESFINAIHIRDTTDGFDIQMDADAHLRDNLLVEEIKRDLYAKAKVRPQDVVHVRITQPPSVRVLARVRDVPGYGWTRWRFDGLGVAPVSVSGPGTEPGTGPHPTTVLDNGLVRVEVDGGTGSLALVRDGVRVEGLARLVDVGDHGDTYNYSPPDVDVLVERPENVAVRVEAAGPLCARVGIDRSYTWPSHIAYHARTGSVRADTTTTVELRAGEPYVRLGVRFINPARDHRVRVHLPLPEAAAGSMAECAFGVVPRGVDAEGGPSERALPTFPSRRFVSAGGLTVAHEGVGEYELVDVRDGNAHELAFTLLRATGMLSRVDMAYRPLPAGPPDRLEGPQMHGAVIERRLAVAIGPVDPYAMVDDLVLPLEVVAAPGGGTRAAEGRALRIEGAEVSMLRRAAHAGGPGGTAGSGGSGGSGGLPLVARVWNPKTSPVTVRLPGRRGQLVDLRGNTVGSWVDSFPLDAAAFATVRIDPAGSDPS